MGLEFLEDKFQKYIKKHPENLARLQTLAEGISSVQLKMRSLLDGITEKKCKICTACCCACLPVEGWFTESDYFLFRMFYEAPFDLRISVENDQECAFLGKQGCSLPKKIRPFPCIKTNCLIINKELAVLGHQESFNQLYDELSSLQEQLWPLIK